MGKLKRINATTYKAELPRATIEIGDGESDQFLPVAKVDSFEGETRFKVGYAGRPFIPLGLDTAAAEVDRIILTEGVHYPPYEVGIWYNAGDPLEYQGGLYEVVQGHTSQADWPPPEVPALYKTSTPPGVIGDWVQPLSAGYEYHLGDMVAHAGQVWKSIIDGNVWEPGVYGWEVTDGRVDVDCYFFDKDGMDAFEFEIVLRDKPLSNVVTMQVEMDGLVAYYQPELTQEEIDAGCYQPEDVIGSYAVYHATCGQIHKAEDAEKYQTGKAFHIYRPRVEDAAGAWVWGELSLDGTSLSITIDQAWLDSASYPVRVDPTFGYTTVGGNWESELSTNRFWGSWFTTPEAGSATSISAYLYSYEATTSQCAVYHRTGTLANDTREAKTEQKAIPVEPGWKTLDFVAESFSFGAGEDVWLIIATELQPSGRYLIKYDVTGTGTSIRWTDDFWDNWPSDLSGGTLVDLTYSIYCTYEASIVPVLTATRENDTIKLTWTYA